MASETDRSIGLGATESNRCAVCGWPLADSSDKGCLRGNCSQRPLPRRFYNLKRAEKEYGRDFEGIADSATKIGLGADLWQPIATAPKDGTPFHAFAEAFIDADFNPSGVIEAVFDGDGRFIGAVWNAVHDIWNTQFVEPTHWMPFPAPPGAASRASRGPSAAEAPQAFVRRIANEALDAWDAECDSRVGKLLAALAGRLPGYRADIDTFHAASRAASDPAPPPAEPEGRS